MPTAGHVHAWLTARGADLTVARRLAEDAIASGRLPAAASVPASAAATAGAVLAAGPLAAAAVASPAVRRFIYEAADTIIACILLVCLLAIVLGLPIGEGGKLWGWGRFFLSRQRKRSSRTPRLSFLLADARAHTQQAPSTYSSRARCTL
jgi:hypothetical protein